MIEYRVKYCAGNSLYPFCPKIGGFCRSDCIALQQVRVNSNPNYDFTYKCSVFGGRELYIDRVER